MTDTPHDVGGETDIEMNREASSPTPASIRKFALPSILGILTFLTPIRVEGNWTILIGFISDSAVKFVGAGMPWIVYVLLCISAVGTVWAVTVGKPPGVLPVAGLECQSSDLDRPLKARLCCAHQTGPKKLTRIMQAWA